MYNYTNFIIIFYFEKKNYRALWTCLILYFLSIEKLFTSVWQTRLWDSEAWLGYSPYLQRGEINLGMYIEPDKAWTGSTINHFHIIVWYDNWKIYMQNIRCNLVETAEGERPRMVIQCTMMSETMGDGKDILVISEDALKFHNFLTT